MLDFDKNQFCVGCTSCYSICNQNAIEIEENANGFYMPVIQLERCVSCGICDSVCPIITKNNVSRKINELKCEYTYQHDQRTRLKSTSGGVFYELALDMIQRGGLVCGCIWDANYTAMHVCTDEIAVINEMRGSKYVQSYLGNCFNEIKHAIKTRPVLFSGTPCQTSALKQYLGNSDNLLTCALICGGVPSPKVWRKYKLALEESKKSKIVDIQMRSKDTNWLVPEIKVTFENKKMVREILLTENLYGTNFGLGLTVSNACMHCGYKLDMMDADILIGDHWGIAPEMLKRSENKGASVIIYLSEKGKSAFVEIRKQMNTEAGDIADVIRSHMVLMHNHCENDSREDFFSCFDDEDIIKYFYRCLPGNIRNSLSKRKKLQKMKLYIPLYTIKWWLKNRYKNTNNQVNNNK